MTTDAEKIIRSWWNQHGDFQLKNPKYQDIDRNQLNGFLDSCVLFGHITATESAKLYFELTITG